MQAASLTTVVRLTRTASAPLAVLPRCSWCITSSMRTNGVWSNVSHRYRSAAAEQALSPPHIEGTEKQYPEKIKGLVNQISELTLVEVADLNELLKKTLNITDAPVMMAAGTASGPAVKKEEEEEEEAEPQATKTSFTVKLVKFDAAKKVPLIKELKNLVSGMNLVQAKKFVESLPQNVMVDIAKDEAEKLKKALEAAGGSAEIE